MPTTPPRRRVILSCKNCKVRKVKCDRRFPCDSCTKRGLTNCMFDDPSSIIASDEVLQKRLVETELEINKLKSQIYGTDVNLESDEAILDTIQSFGNLNVSEGQERYHGYIPGNTDSKPEDVLPAMIWKAKHLPGISREQRQKISQIQEILMPKKAIAYSLTQRFLTANPAAFLWIHPSRFFADLEQLYKIDKETSISPILETRPFVVTVILAVISVALKTYSNTEDLELAMIEAAVGMNSGEFRQLIRQGISDIFDTGDFLQNYDLDVVTALSINYLNSDLFSKSLTLTNTGLVLYMAQSLGDPKTLGMSPLNCEIRRRLWFAIRTFEIECTWSEGLPCHIPDEDTDCLFPSFDPTFDQVHILAQQSLEWSRHIFGYTIRILGKMAAEICSIKTPNPMKIAELDKLVSEIDAEKPDWLRVDTTTKSHSLFFRQVAAELCLSRYLLYVHLPFQHNTSYPGSRARVVEAAKRTMRVFCQYDERPFEDLQMYRWFGEVWMYSTPLLATLVLAMELITLKSGDAQGWELVERTEAALHRAPELSLVPVRERAMGTIRKLVEERSFRDFEPGLVGHGVLKDIAGYGL